MAATISAIFLMTVLVYLSVGLIFALLFAFRWVDEMDEQAKGAPLMFRLLIIPASTLLWIYLIKKVREKKK